MHECYVARHIGEARYSPVGEVGLHAGLLKLYREKERSRDVDPFSLDTLLVSSARSNLIRPKTEARRVRFAVEKIIILLANKELRIIDRVREWLNRDRVVIYDCDRYRVRIAGQKSCSCLEQQDVESFRWVNVRIVDNQNLHALTRFSRAELKRARKFRFCFQ